MQFVEEQSNSVTDITIPEGNVVKIEEADTGRVLWERKSKLPDDLSDISLEWSTIGLNEISPDYSEDDRTIVAIASPISPYINSEYENNPNVITIRACVNSSSGSAIKDTIYEAPCLYRKNKNEWAKILNPASLIRFGEGLSEDTGIVAISNDGNIILVRSNEKTHYIENGEELPPFWLCSNIQYGNELQIDSTNNKNYGLKNLYMFPKNNHIEFVSDGVIKIEDGYTYGAYSQYVSIIYSPELKKYLLTALLYDYKYEDYDLNIKKVITTDTTIVRNFSFPETFSSFEITEQDGKSIIPANAIQTYINKSYGTHTVNPCWSSKYHSFFAGYLSVDTVQINENYFTRSQVYENYLLTSSDGISWTRKKLFSDDTPVYGVIELTTSDRLCAIGNGKIALSDDSITWEEKELLFTGKPRAWAYSPEYNLFCIISNKNTAYVTRNFETWKQSEKAPIAIQQFSENNFIHCGDGIFAAGRTATNKNFLMLTTVHPIRGTITL